MSDKKKERIRALKFLLFSMSAGVIQFTTFELMYNIGKWNYWVCYVTALALSVIWNFTFNRKFTFKSATNVPIAMLKVAAFYAVFTPATMFGGQALVDAGWNGDLVNALTMLLNLVTEFLYQRFFVFGKSILL